MKQHGSVLVVVLGLLAILAVIGVAFLTLSSLERSTAANFAMQTQMMLAADGALDYAVHQMVLDVWEWEVTGTDELPVFAFTGSRLLSGREAAKPTTGKKVPYNWACEPYDFRRAGTDPFVVEDTWLSGNITTGNTAPSDISFAGDVVKRFGVNFGGTTAVVDNLGMPVTAPAKNGIWIPDLAAPCDQYLVRASVTILDHNALVNLNAHGNRDTGGIDWVYDDCRGQGYFVSDVDPSALGVNREDLVGRVGAATPGCWGADAKPGNPKAGAVLIENPAAGNDFPYTLDEEFELRNLWGTYFKSRLENIWPTLLSNPSTASAYTPRLKTTTVSWTAEVSGDAKPTVQQPNPQHKTTGGGWSAAKVDLNTASSDDIYNTLRDGRAWEDTSELKQLVANIVAFRRKGVANFTAVSVGGANFYGAQRQPFFTEASSTLESEEELIPGDPSTTQRTYRVKLEVYNPWPGDYDGAPAGLNTKDITVAFLFKSDETGDYGRSIPASTPLPLSMGEFQCAGTGGSLNFTVICNNNNTLKDAVIDIRLLWKKFLVLDKISDADLQTLQSGHISRKVFRTSETRGSRDNSPIYVLYVGDWQTGGNENLGSVTLDNSIESSAIPIRFPNCVPDGATGLPVRAGGGKEFKAFARVGDLNQVLRFSPGGDPWIVTVSRKPRIQENDVKFDWMKNIDNVAAGTGTAAAYAANVLSVGGPWNDGLDNDGDGKTDLDDTGKSGAGRTGGPEFRVAGKINLNTATSETLSALGISAGSLPAKPIKTPAQVLTNATVNPAGLEQRDLPFTLISNIATVRSDTFSVYGTVQIVDPAAKDGAGNIPDSAVIRSRRFWALVDRSPSLAYPPTDKANFIYPRILNFQWLD